MRIDKFLKVSRVLKRRTVAQDACAANKVTINNKPAKAGTQVKVGDTITVNFSTKPFVFKVVEIREHIKADLAHTLYEIV